MGPQLCTGTVDCEGLQACMHACPLKQAGRGATRSAMRPIRTTRRTKDARRSGAAVKLSGAEGTTPRQHHPPRRQHHHRRHDGSSTHPPNELRPCHLAQKKGAFRGRLVLLVPTYSRRRVAFRAQHSTPRVFCHTRSTWSCQDPRAFSTMDWSCRRSRHLYSFRALRVVRHSRASTRP